jgi:hypothetical protein
MNPVTDAAHRGPTARAAGRVAAAGRGQDGGRRARHPVTLGDEPDLPRTEPEFRPQSLGFALRSLAAALVEERRHVAQLRREVAELKSRLESLQPTPHGDQA